MSARLDRELAEVLAKLEPREREQVLEYARALQDHDDVPTPSLLEFVGCISKEDARLMREAIEEEFERVHGTP
jgi:hypothetical protein